MAAIRMSNVLKQAILENVNLLYDARTEALKRDFTEAMKPSEVINVLYYALVFSEKNMAPLSKFLKDYPTMDEFVLVPNKFHFHVNLTIADKNIGLITLGEFKNPNKFPAKKKDFNTNQDFASVIFNMKLKPKGETHPLLGLNKKLDKAIGIALTLHEVVAEFDDLSVHAKRIVNNSNSLRQFLEAWPGGASLVPEESLEKLHKKGPGRSAVLQKSGISDDQVRQMNVSLAKAKVLKN